jgi:alpha-1,6-mannosyltransferase
VLGTRAVVLLRTDRLSLRRIRQAGFVGSCVLVVGAIFAGVLPWRDGLAISATVRHLRSFTAPSVAVVFVGVCLLLLAWWRLGTLVHRRDAHARQLAVTGLVDGPLLIATPLFS